MPTVTKPKRIDTPAGTIGIQVPKTECLNHQHWFTILAEAQDIIEDWRID